MNVEGAPNHPQEPSKPTATDELLAPYLQAVTEEESEQILAQLIAQQLNPIVKEIVTYKLRFAGGGARFADEQ
ncbi:MAG: hypothetical protein M3X11_17650 [Acidobacteriota bacterium]|nr:hypothetical protein [Acidobacteriota bacterium]